TILPLLPGIPFTSVGGLNDVGDFAGTARSSSPPGPGSNAVLWNNGTITDQGTLGSTGIFVFGINNQKQIIGGASGLQNSGNTAFMLKIGQLSLLPSLAGQSDLARGINDSGDIVGTSQTGGHNHAVIWQNGLVTDLAPTASSSTAFAINSSGQVAGSQA